jgi:hypothetical protein
MKSQRDTRNSEKRGASGNLRPVRVTDLKGATRLLARVLFQLQKEDISESKAKTISYVCNSYIKAFELSEVEKRVLALEQSAAPESESQGEL